MTLHSASLRHSAFKVCAATVHRPVSLLVLSAVLLVGCGAPAGGAGTSGASGSGLVTTTQLLTSSSSGSSGAGGGSGGTSSSDTSGTGDTSSDSTGSQSEPEPEPEPEPVPPPVGCDRSQAITMVVSEDITSDTTWSGVVSLTQEIDIHENATLTIEPGTTIIAKSGSGIDIGWNSGAATVKAAGTAEKPIHFCGENANPGVWLGIAIRKNTARSSVFSHVVIEDAGSSGDRALLLMSPIEMRHVAIVNSQGTGIEANDFHPDSSHLHVSKTKVPASLLSADAVSRFPNPSSVSGNELDRVELRFSDASSDIKMRNLGVPYLQYSDLYVIDAATWSIEPGTKYKLAAGVTVNVGWNGAAATVLWKGTAERPIVFSAQSNSPGGWGRMEIGGKTTLNSAMKHVTIKEAERSLLFSAPIKVEHLSVEDAMDGVEIEATGLGPGSSVLNVRRVKGAAVKAHPHALFSLPSFGDFAENKKNVVMLLEGDLRQSGTIKKLPVPYMVVSSFDVVDGADITIEPGVQFLMGAGTDIEFGWNSSDAGVKMLGNKADPIVFRGLSELPGFWRGLSLGSKIRGDSKLQYVDIAHAGASDAGMLELRRSVEVLNCHLHDSAGFAILKEAGDTRDYKGLNRFNNNSQGDVGEFAGR